MDLKTLLSLRASVSQIFRNGLDGQYWGRISHEVSTSLEVSEKKKKKKSWFLKPQSGLSSLDSQLYSTDLHIYP